MNKSLLTTAFLGATPLLGLAAESKPNILFISVDDLRIELGCYGNSVVKTPNIDKLAKQGTTFERAYWQQAGCSPSRVSLLCGQRPDTTKVYDLVTKFRDIQPNIVTLPQYFKNNGYHTFKTGKIYHLGHGHTTDETSWSEEGVFSGRRYVIPQNITDNTAYENEDVADNIYYDGAQTEAAIAALPRLKDDDKPFFMAVGFKKPHLPFNAPKKYLDIYSDVTIPVTTQLAEPTDVSTYALSTFGELRAYKDIPETGALTSEMADTLKKRYYACVSYVDAQIGLLMNALESNQLNDNTIIVLWSDHGWKLNDYSSWCKHTCMEVDTRVPLLIINPGSKADNRVLSPVELVDLYPTLASLCGLAIPSQCEGTDISRLLNNPTAFQKKAAFSQYPRSGHMGYSVFRNNFRYTEWINDTTNVVTSRELYNHSNGILASANLVESEEYEGTVTEMSALLNMGTGWQAVKTEADEFASQTTAPLFSADTFALANADKSGLYVESLLSYVSNPDNVKLTFSKVSGPGVFTVNEAGNLAGLPTYLTTAEITVEVSDEQGRTDTALFTIEVVTPPATIEASTTRPVVTGASLEMMKNGTKFIWDAVNDEDIKAYMIRKRIAHRWYIVDTIMNGSTLTTTDTIGDGAEYVVDAIYSDGSFTTAAVEDSYIELDYELETGWNLISAPFSINKTELASGATTATLWYWDADHYEQTEQLTAQQGGWIYATEPLTVTLSGIPQHNELTLTAGWNLIDPATYSPHVSKQLWTWKGGKYEKANEIIPAHAYWSYTTTNQSKNFPVKVTSEDLQALGTPATGAIDAALTVLNRYHGNWQKNAIDRIKSNRQTEINLTILDQQGRPVTTSDLQIEHVKHDFLFGGILNIHQMLGVRTGSETDTSLYRQQMKKFFNAAGFANAFKYKLRNGFEQYLPEGIEVVENAELPLRGHALIWPGWSHLPPEFKDLEESPDELRSTCTDMISAWAKKWDVVEWDVINEPRANHDLQDILGSGVEKSWFDTAHENVSANCKLYVNDYQMISGVNESYKEFYDAFITRMLDEGAPIDGIGFQSRFKYRIPPEEVYQSIERFSKHDLLLKATEFEVMDKVQTFTEPMRAKTTFEVLHTHFSHPSMEGVYAWTFYDKVDTSYPNGRTFCMVKGDGSIKANGLIWLYLINKLWNSDQVVSTDDNGKLSFHGFTGTYRLTATVNGLAYSAVFDTESIPAELTLSVQN